MGNVAKRPDGRWRARYRDPSGRERARHFDRKLDADRWLASVETAMGRGEWLDPNLSLIRYGAWAAQWLDGQVQLKLSTRYRYMTLLRVQVLPTWERVPLRSITHAAVVAWVGGMSGRGLSGSTVRQAHRVFSLTLSLAIKDGRLPRNPAEGVRLPRTASAEKRFLSYGEVEALAAASGSYALLVRLLAYTGLRFGEAAALRVHRVNALRRRLEVTASTTEVGGRAVFGTPKNHHRRSVPVPPSLVAPLVAAIEGKASEDLVFTSPEGGVLRNGNFRSRFFDRAASSVGLDGLTPHELRHTAASLAVASGANVKAVQRMLGHASAAMTLDVYAGLFGDDLDDVAQRLDEQARRARADQVRTSGPEVPKDGAAGVPAKVS